MGANGRVSLQRTVLVGVIALLTAVCGGLAYAYTEVRSDVQELRTDPAAERDWWTDEETSPVAVVENDLSELTDRLDLLESRLDASVETYPIEVDLVERVSEIERQLRGSVTASPRAPDFQTLEQRLRKLESCITDLTGGYGGSEYDCP